MSHGSPTQHGPQMSALQYVSGFVGILVGAAVGCGVVTLLFRWGFYGVMLVGLCTGWGSSLFSQSSSKLLGIACVLVALPATIGISWYCSPFVVDDSLVFYLQHLHKLKPIQLVMIGLGTLMAYYVGKGRG